MEEEIRIIRVEKLAVVIGPNEICIGPVIVYADYCLGAKNLGDFGKIYPNIRNKEGLTSFYADFDEVNPVKKEKTGRRIPVFFFGPLTGKKFSFEDNSPAELMLNLRTLQTENNYLRNEFHKLLDLVDAVSVDDFKKKMIQDHVEHSRKLISNPYSNFNTGGNK